MDRWTANAGQEPPHKVVSPRNPRQRGHRSLRSLVPLPSVPVLAATIAINLLALAIPLFSIQVYDRIIAQRGYSTLYVLGIGVAIALLLELALRLLRSQLIGRAAAITEAAQATGALQALAAAELLTLQRQSSSRWLQSFQAIGRLREFNSGQAFITLLELPFGALYLWGIAYLSGPLVLVPLLLLASFAIRALWLGASLQTLMANRETADRKRYAFLTETLTGIHTLKAYGAELRQLRRFEHLQDESNGTNYQAVAIANTAAGDGALYAQLMLGGMVLCGAWLTGGGWHAVGMSQPLTLGALIACVLLAGRVMQPVQRAFGLWHRFQEGQLADVQLRRLRLLQHDGGTTEISDHAPAAVSAPVPTPVLYPTAAAIVTLRDVGFGYGTRAIFQKLNLTIMSGEAISIGGAAGCGKSTLLRLLSGLYSPSQGTIEFHEQPHAKQGQLQLAPGVAYLRANAGTLRGTIADNLTRFGTVSLAEMLPLARLLRLDQDIARLPLGYATQLTGTQADSVPPGFKQRLALVRALAPANGQPPRLVLYDEADRGLDAQGYAALLLLLGHLARQTTLVMVSGDRAVHALAQRHYQLQHGRLHDVANQAGAHLPSWSSQRSSQRSSQGESAI